MFKSSRKDNPIFRVAVFIPLNRVFDYLAPENLDFGRLAPGVRLQVPFGRAKRTAVLLGIADRSDLDPSQLKSVSEVLDEESLLSQADLELLHWASRYYHHPLGEVLSAAFPVLLRQGKPAVIKTQKRYCLTECGRELPLEELARAPRQMQLMALFRAENGAPDPGRLAQWNKNWRATAAFLLKKGYLREIDGAAAVEGSTLPAAGSEIRPNPDQLSAVEAVCDRLTGFSVFLLEGVTGSGKTEVYMQIIRRVIERGGQVIVLLPEITLTPQLEARFRQRFSASIAVSHSGLTDAERKNAWLSMRQGDCSILLGTRSALFTPLPRPGLIVVDEEHDASFKQQEGFRFSARDLAIVRAKQLDVPVVLGSATPSLESLYNAENGRYRLLHLPQRAGEAVAPDLRLLDIRNKKVREGLSDVLIAEIGRTLASGEQVLIFLNRRGFAPVLMCQACGWVAQCGRCDASLVIHRDENRLRCHHCAHEQKLLQQCPACNAGELIPVGLGTERVEGELARLFPRCKIVRLDRDTTQRKGALEELLRQINQGSADIILGTQMLAKGHHFPNVTLVGVLDVDSGLFSIDYHAAERLAQLIVQVSGRAGRELKPGRVVLQTRQPEHPLLQTLIKNGYREFALRALEERKSAGLPPFTYQALFRVLAVDRQTPIIFLDRIRGLIEERAAEGVCAMGPVPSPMARRSGKYRFQLLLQSGRRRDLHRLLDEVMPEIERLKENKKVRWSLDVDPIDLY
ncbi:MAG: primosomal protein N' [Gammaproteobacteria bacterium]